MQKIKLKDNNGISLIVLCIILIIILIILLAGTYFFIVKQEKKTVDQGTNILEKYNAGDVITKIQNLEFYVNENYQLKDKKIDQGFIIYCNGSIEQYDDINNERKIIKILKQKEINNLLELIQNIDENKLSTINTIVAIPKGQIIKVYNTEKEEITIQDFYSNNYSDATEKIKKFLKKENLL